jgi:hypothetical protein
VLVADEPVWDEPTAAELRERLARQKAFYAAEGHYPDDAARARMLTVFADALDTLSQPAATEAPGS